MTTQNIQSSGLPESEELQKVKAQLAQAEQEITAYDMTMNRQSKLIAELQAQLEAVGAGGVTRLMPRPILGAVGSRDVDVAAKQKAWDATQPAGAGGSVGASREQQITLDFKQATELLDMFGGEPSTVTLAPGDGHSGKGLYAYWSEIPEEGAIYLGLTDDEATPAPSVPAGGEGQHLFEFWWAEYMPEAKQDRAWEAWQAAPESRNVGVAALTPQDAAPAHQGYITREQAFQVRDIAREFHPAAITAKDAK